MKLQSLMVLAVLCALLMSVLFFTGCSDRAGSDQLDFSQFNILLYYDGVPEGNFAQQALDNLGATYTLVTSPAELFAQGGNAFHLLVIDNPNLENEAMLDSIEGYIEVGGRVAISTWQSDWHPTHTIWATLGSTSGDAPSEDVSPVFKWDITHPIFTFPNDAPNLTALTDDIDYRVNFFPGDVANGSTALAGVSSTPITGQALLFLGESQRTIYNAFLLMDAVSFDGTNFVPNDVDEDGNPDGREYWENEIVFLLAQNDVDPVEVPIIIPSTRAAGTNNGK